MGEPTLTPIPNQRWLRIIPAAFVMYTIAFVDRTNISLAKPSMSHDLAMNPAEAGLVDGIFFWGYLVLQIPGGYLASRWSAKRFVSVLLVAWGVCSMACGLVQSWEKLALMRFLLGVAEGGVWPATLVLLSHWFPRGERARANAFWMLCLPLAVIASSPLSGWILGRWNWRVLLISEGALPVVWLVIWWVFIDDHPRQAGWISLDEREYLERTLEREAVELEPAAPLPFRQVLLRPQVLIMMGVYFLMNSGSYGFLFWLPSAIHGKARSLSEFQVALLFAFPFVIAAIAMVLISQHSDRRGERRGHVSFGLGWGGLFFLAGILLSRHAPGASFLMISMVGVGAYGPLGPFWAIPTETLPRGVAGSAMGLINAIGNLGGWAGPQVVGLLNLKTGNFTSGFALLSTGMILASVLARLFFPKSRPAKPVETKPSLP